MQLLRAFLLRHRTLALFVAVATLCLKAALPAGYMLEQQARVLRVVLCSDASGQPLRHDIVLGAAAKPSPAANQQAKADPACPWSALAFAALGGLDASLLAALLGFILALGFAPVRPIQPGRLTRLLPPLRGPPVLA